MGIPVVYFQFDGLAYDSGDISFGDGESKDITINTGTTINKVTLTKKTVTFKARGCSGSDLAILESKRDAAISQMLRGGAPGADINILGKVIESAYVSKVTPSAPIKVDGIVIFESIDTEYTSQVFS